MQLLRIVQIQIGLFCAFSPIVRSVRSTLGSQTGNVQGSRKDGHLNGGSSISRTTDDVDYEDYIPRLLRQYIGNALPNKGNHLIFENAIVTNSPNSNWTILCIFSDSQKCSEYTRFPNGKCTRE
eukprot:Filipodium_phascolosomae@DN8156_c0_g1_i1.p1